MTTIHDLELQAANAFNSIAAFRAGKHTLQIERYISSDNMGREAYFYSYKLDGKTIGRVRASNVVAKSQNIES